jgi:hypothetical protein
VKPFEVYNPISGRWFILHWWTDEDRGHLAFASTEDGLRKVAAGVFKKAPYAEVKTILEIEAVGPSDKISRMAAEHDAREQVDNFYHEIIAPLTEAIKAGKSLPAPFTTCDKYEPSEDVEIDEWSKERHYGCRNCEYMVRHVGMTKGDLYAKFHDAWVAANPKPVYVASPRNGEPVRTVSKAEKASDDEPLWFAYANFGPHAGGVELRELNLADSDEYRPQCLSTSTLFFYRLIRVVEADTVIAMAKDAKHVAQEASRRRDRANKKKYEAEAARKIASAIEFFHRAGQS